jgi:hypothetical protein
MLFTLPATVSSSKSLESCLSYTGKNFTLSSVQQFAGAHGNVTQEQLEAEGAALCARSVLTLFDNSAALRAAVDAGDSHGTCADWDVHGAKK